MPIPAQYIPPPGCWLGAWMEGCGVLMPSKRLSLLDMYDNTFPLSLGEPHCSAQPYLMNFSMTSSTHICSRRKLMP